MTGAFDAKGAAGEIRAGYKTVATFGAWVLEAGALSAEEVPVLSDVAADVPGRRSIWLRLGRYWWVWDDGTVHSYRPVRATLTGRHRTRLAE